MKRRSFDNWDIYDIIIKVNKYSFRVAQETFAEYMSITDFVPYGGIDSMPDKENKPDEPVNFVEPKELDKDVKTALYEAADFYHEFLRQKDRLEGWLQGDLGYCKVQYFRIIPRLVLYRDFLGRFLNQR